LTVASNTVLTVTDIHWWIHSVKRSRKQLKYASKGVVSKKKKISAAVANIFIVAVLLGRSEDVGLLVLGWTSLVHTLILCPAIRTTDLVLTYVWKKNGNAEYKAQRSLYFWDVSLLMIFGTRTLWMRGHQALNHRAKKKRKVSRRKKDKIKKKKEKDKKKSKHRLHHHHRSSRSE